jgi:Tfp pilus assembly protein FimV
MNMLSLFDVIGHAGTLVSVLAVAAAVAALVYVPSPLKHYAVAACLCAAVASQIYAEGYHRSDDEWQAKYDRQIAAINDETQKAVIGAEAKAKAEAEANARNLRAQLDALAQAKAASDASLSEAEARIAAAPKDDHGADAPAPQILLDAVRSQ